MAKTAGTPLLQDLLRDLPRQLRSDSHVQALLSRAIVLAFILPLYGKPLETRVGMGLTYQKLFGKALGTVSSLVRTLRSSILAETRKLLRVGSEAYVKKALEEIEELFKSS